jgi:EAL domain-containing protein (putative c-di-GMP-specific phosphodiesterase class I)
MVSPAEFIPIAEESGLIVPLGDWIIKAACAQIRVWSDKEFFRDLSLSVNVSARQFNQSNFIESLLGSIDHYSIDPRTLKLELTESLLVQNVEEVIEKMEQLKNHGIRFSLDDFGTGYSSLSYLKRLPLDQLKIDQGFVRDLLIDSNDAIICKSTIALAQSMGLSVIAEGVETLQQLEVLRSFGCRAYQGYYFSRPLDIEAFERYSHG